MAFKDFYEWDGKEIKVYRLSELMDQHSFVRDYDAFTAILSEEEITPYEANWATKPGRGESFVSCRIIFIEWFYEGGELYGS